MGYDVQVTRQATDCEVIGCGIGIEAKTIPDLASSIIDERVFRQADELALFYPYPFITISGDPAEFRLLPQVFWGACASLEFKHGCRVVFTFDHFHMWLDATIRKITNTRKRRSRVT
jgi:ERCC4-type nuclease